MWRLRICVIHLTYVYLLWSILITNQMSHHQNATPANNSRQNLVHKVRFFCHTHGTSYFGINNFIIQQFTYNSNSQGSIALLETVTHQRQLTIDELFNFYYSQLVTEDTPFKHFRHVSIYHCQTSSAETFLQWLKRQRFFLRVIPWPPHPQPFYAQISGWWCRRRRPQWWPNLLENWRSWPRTATKTCTEEIQQRMA